MCQNLYIWEYGLGGVLCRKKAINFSNCYGLINYLLYVLFVKVVEEAVQLVIPKSKGEDNNKVYTYQQLNDLQSKLMLVAGKATEGKEQVDRFVEVSVVCS